VQVVEHGRVVLLRAVVLVLQDRRGAAGIAGEEKEQVVLEVVEGLLRDLAGPVLDAAVLVEGEGRDPADGGDVLVLLADRLAEPVDLDVAGLLGQLRRRDEVLLVGVERLEERRREAARGAEPVPPGMSAIDVSSMWGSVTPVSFRASRTMGCSIWSTEATRSSFEYLTMISSWKVVCLVM
jgi:hypothetical protein